MTSAISAASTSSITNTMFAKLDTQQKGYIEQADMTAAAGTDQAAASKAAEAFQQIDTNGDGKVTKSELSAAVDKVGGQLQAQQDASRTQSASGTGKTHHAHGGHGHHGGASAVASADSTDPTGSVATAADSTQNDSLTAQQAAADAKALAQVQEYQANSGEFQTHTPPTVSVSV